MSEENALQLDVELYGIKRNTIFELLYLTPVHVGTIEFPQLQKPFAIAIGSAAGNFAQSTGAIALGELAGTTEQSEYAIALGNLSGSYNQGLKSIAIGTMTSQTQQGESAVAIGYLASVSYQSAKAIAIGVGSEATQQDSIALGYMTIPQIRGIAVGNYTKGEGSDAITIGYNSGENQSTNSITVGCSAKQYYPDQRDSIFFGQGTILGQGFESQLNPIPLDNPPNYLWKLDNFSVLTILPFPRRIIAMATDYYGVNIIATDGNGIFISNDSGLTWSERKLVSIPIFAVSCSGFGQGIEVMAACSNSVYVSNDTGSTWNIIPGTFTKTSQANPKLMHVTLLAEWVFFISSDDYVKIIDPFTFNIYTVTNSNGYQFRMLCCSFSGRDLLLASATGRLYKCTLNNANDFFTSIIPIYSAGLRNWSSIAMSYSSQYACASVNPGNIYLSTNMSYAIPLFTEYIVGGGAQYWTDVSCKAGGLGEIVSTVVSQNGVYQSIGIDNIWTLHQTGQDIPFLVASNYDMLSQVDYIGTRGSSSSNSIFFNSTSSLTTIPLDTSRFYVSQVRQRSSEFTAQSLLCNSSTGEISSNSLLSPISTIFKKGQNYSDILIADDRSLTGNFYWTPSSKVRLGRNSGYMSTEQTNAIAIGSNSSTDAGSQDYSISLGCVQQNNGWASVSVGQNACAQLDRSIAIYSGINNFASDSCVIGSIRTLSTGGAGFRLMSYNMTTKEICVSSSSSITPSALSNTARAFVSFTVNPLTVRSQSSNITSVVKIATGMYYVTFASGTFSSANYNVNVGITSTSDSVANAIPYTNIGNFSSPSPYVQTSTLCPFVTTQFLVDGFKQAVDVERVYAIFY